MVNAYRREGRDLLSYPDRGILSATTKQSCNKSAGESIQQKPEEATLNEGVTIFTCLDCQVNGKEVSYPTKQGLGQHRRWRHKIAVDAEKEGVAASRKGGVWDDEGLKELLARKFIEFEHLKGVGSGLYVKLAELLPLGTANDVERIRKRCLHSDQKLLVQRIREEMHWENDDNQLLLARKFVQYDHLSGDALYSRLAELFPSSTPGGIRNQLQLPILAELVQRVRDELSVGIEAEPMPDFDTELTDEEINDDDSVHGTGAGGSRPVLDAQQGTDGQAAVRTADGENVDWREHVRQYVGTLEGLKNAEAIALHEAICSNASLLQPLDKYLDMIAGNGTGTNEKADAMKKKKKKSRPPFKLEGLRPAVFRKLMRRRQYARIQHLYKTQRSRACREIAEGSWEQSDKGDGIEDAAKLAYWKGMFEKGKVVDSREVRPSRVHWECLRPVTTEEVSGILKSLSATAPGPDGLLNESLKKMPIAELTVMLNAALLCDAPPKSFLISRTTLISKTAAPKDPTEFRPISVSNVGCRLFHKLLAARLLSVFKIDDSQRAFRSIDGIAANVELLDCLIKDAKRRLRELKLGFIDLKKAFDSVHHDSIVRAAKRMGTPEPILEYLRSYYALGETELLGARVRMTTGVRQGDPLSPLLFNAVIDEALVKAKKDFPSTGYRFSDRETETRVSSIAFADDLVLVASNEITLQALVDNVLTTLAEAGLCPNPAKCATLRIGIDKKKKCWFNARRLPSLQVGGEGVAFVDSEQAYKYLGLQFAGFGMTETDVGSKLKAMIENISRAPLKPQQRLFILRQHVVPKFLHGLVLGKTTLNALRSFDRILRAAIRKWTNLPPDTPLGFYHASSADGGLGIPSLRTVVPRVAKARKDNLVNIEDKDIRSLVSSVAWERKLHASLPTKFEGQTVSSSRQEKQFWRDRLYASCDGKGLQHMSMYPRGSEWVKSGNLLQSGFAFQQTLKIRSATWITPHRASRGVPMADPRCDADGCMEARATLSHMVQSCTRTHSAIVKRHDRVVSLLAAKLGDKRVIVEPRIWCKLRESDPRPVLRMPDLIVREDDRAWILDVQISSDAGIPEGKAKAYSGKVEYYSKYAESILRYCQASWDGITACDFGAVILDWRGAFFDESVRLLKRLRVSDSTLQLCVIKTLEGSAAAAEAWHKSTVRPRTNRRVNRERR